VSTLLEFVRWIVAKGEADPEVHQRRGQFYSAPTATMVARGLTNRRDQVAFCGMDSLKLQAYVEQSYGAAEAKEVGELLDSVVPAEIRPYYPLPHEIDLAKDPWEGQPCGQEQAPKVESRGKADSEARYALLHAMAWGRPKRVVETVMPHQPPRTGQDFRLVASGEGLRPGYEIVLQHVKSGQVFPFVTNLFHEVAFTGSFIGCCVRGSTTSLPDGTYRVVVRDPFGILEEIRETPSFRVAP